MVARRKSPDKGSSLLRYICNLCNGEQTITMEVIDMKKVIKVIVIIVIGCLFMSAIGGSSYDRGFKDGIKYHQELIQEIKQSSSYGTTTTEWSP